MNVHYKPRYTKQQKNITWHHINLLLMPMPIRYILC